MFIVYPFGINQFICPWKCCVQFGAYSQRQSPWSCGNVSPNEPKCRQEQCTPFILFCLLIFGKRLQVKPNREKTMLVLTVGIIA